MNAARTDSHRVPALVSASRPPKRTLFTPNHTPRSRFAAPLHHPCAFAETTRRPFTSATARPVGLQALVSRLRGLDHHRLLTRAEGAVQRKRLRAQRVHGGRRARSLSRDGIV